MSRKSSNKTIRKTIADLRKPSAEELDRLEALPEGTPDAESPEWTPAQIAAAAEARRQRILEQAGRARKHRITINLDEDLIAYFKALGEQGYQTRINDALRAYIAHQVAASGNARDLIEQAKAALEQAERVLEQDHAA